MNLLSIIWNVNPEIFHIGPLVIRWYSLLWVCAIMITYRIVKKLFKHEGYPDDWADKLFVYATVGLIIGARLGHCFFYDFSYYVGNPIEIIKVWEGGLSSHGGAIGLLIAAYLYNRKVTKKGYLWILDRLVIGVALGGACIRLGNLMNSEIYGEATSLPWGFIFVRAGETEPMHPTQIYEMLYCFVTFAIVWWLYWKKQAYRRSGIIFGTALIVIFGIRFLLEFIKWNQEAFEDSMLLNMGQLLSLPFVIWGIWLLLRKPKPANDPDKPKPAANNKK